MSDSAIRLPANGWRPRPYQQPAWNAWERGIKRILAIWHRRAGKDDIALHMAAIAAHTRIGTYWHMLPEYAQARKAIWNAVNPNTSKRRIDEAFPRELRANTNDHEMFIRFRSGSTWQVVGSDQFNSLVGTPPIGVVFSEWALANPGAWGYLAPILSENGGWAVFITTPRGRNHVKAMLDMARTNPAWFAQVLKASDTKAIAPEVIEEQRREYHSIFGVDDGDSLIEQEYNCSFDASLVGSYYGKMINQAELDGRIGDKPPIPGVPVQTAWDLGWTDDTVIWFYQVVGRKIRFIDYYAAHGRDIPHYAEVVHDRDYSYARHWLPHDATPRTFAANGRTIAEQMYALGVKPLAQVPETSVQNGIQAGRMVLQDAEFDAVKCKDGIEALRQYQREWDDDKKCFRDTPRHDWASHPADGFRYAALSAREPPPPPDKGPKGKFFEKMTLNELWASQPSRGHRI